MKMPSNHWTANPEGFTTMSMSLSYRIRIVTVMLARWEQATALARSTKQRRHYRYAASIRGVLDRYLALYDLVGSTLDPASEIYLPVTR